MHMLFTSEELKWIDTKTFGWHIKKECPEKVRKSIEQKLNVIANQFKGKNKNVR